MIYLLEAGDAAVARLRDRLDALGDSLVVVGGDGLWNVHVHVDDAGAAVEAGVEAGPAVPDPDHPLRPGRAHRRRRAPAARARPARRRRRRPRRGPRRAVRARPARPPCSPAPGSRPPAASWSTPIRRAHAREVVLLPNDADLRHTAAAAAEQARAEGVRVALIPTRSAVQGIAALAVHEPDRRFDEDVVAMTSAAGATRYAELAVAERQSWTMAGICQAGDVLGLIDGDVAVIGADLAGDRRRRPRPDALRRRRTGHPGPRRRTSPTRLADAPGGARPASGHLGRRHGRLPRRPRRPRRCSSASE